MTDRPLTEEEAENLMNSAGIDRYDSLRRRSIESGQETTAPPVRNLLRDSVVKVAREIMEWLKKASRTPGRNHIAVPLLKQVKPEVAALIASQVILDSISIERPLTATAISIGAALEDEAWFSLIKRKSSQEFRTMERLTKSRTESHRRRVMRAAAAEADVEFDRWGTRRKLQVGIVMVSLFEESTSIIEVVKKESSYRGKPKTTKYIRPTEELESWLRRADAAHRTMFPLYLPTVQPPDPWVGQYEGGYPANVYMRWPLVKAPRNVRDRIIPELCPEFYDAINSIQSTAWRINPDVYEILDYYWTEGIALAGVPARDAEELPSKPHDIDTNEPARREWCRAASRVHARNATLAGRRTLTSRIHFVASQYRHQDLWFPHKADFRGRIYPVPAFLSPQGVDLAKGLLEFSEAAPVDTQEARDWLAIHGANCWGEDKKPLAERLKWVEDNSRMVRDIARDPLDIPIWTDADEPFQFLAWCLDWSNLLDAEDESRVHYSNLPVAMDGSNNGLQLYSLLLRDTEGGKATNVLPSDEPRDLYADVARLATRKLLVDSESFDENKNRMAKAWLGFVGSEIPRAATKRPVMVQPYGGTIFSCREYIEDWYEEELMARGLKDDRPFPTTFAHTKYLSELVWESIEEVVVGAREGMEWLRKVASIVSETGRPIEWTTPVGFLVSQFRESQKSKVVRTTIGKSVQLQTRLMVGTGKVNARGMKDSIAPNFIHSLDAAIMMRTVNRCTEAGITAFAMVHDSYATHAANAATLARELRAAVAEIFEEDILAAFKAQIERDYNVELPPLPAYGTLNPRDVLDSTYFFA